MSGLDPNIAIRAADEGRKASKPFASLFAPLQFVPPSSAKTIETIIRDQALKTAADYFESSTAKPMTNAYLPSVSKVAKPANGDTPSGIETFFLPWPQLTGKGNEIMVREGAQLIFLRVDLQKGLVLRGVEADSIAPYFKHCKGLGVPDSSDRKWVWLTRCIAPRQHVMYPYTAGIDRGWIQGMAVGGNLTAQATAEYGGHYQVPDENSTAEVNMEYWAMLFSGIKEEDPVGDRLVHVETPAPRAQLIDSEAIDKAVVAFTKMKAAVSGPYTSETRDEPTKDKPSVASEIVGAVAVAAGVALATGVVAALV